MFNSECVQSLSFVSRPSAARQPYRFAGLASRLAAAVNERNVVFAGASAGLVFAGGVVLKALAQAF
jgi:hypothetical protein